MAGRGPQTFKKRQKEQQRKERQAEKIASRLQRKHKDKLPETDDRPFEAATSEEPTGVS